MFDDLKPIKDRYSIEGLPGVQAFVIDEMHTTAQELLSIASTPEHNAVQNFNRGMHHALEQFSNLLGNLSK